jgi:hypothetical protein
MDRLSQDSPIEQFFSAFPPDMAPLREQLLRQKNLLDGFGFVTPGALLGTLTVQEPADYKSQKRTMTAESRKSFAEATNPKKRRQQLATLLKLSAGEMDLLVERLNELPRPLQATKTIRSEGYAGLIGTRSLRSSQSYHIIGPEQYLHREPKSGGRVLLPDLSHRLGVAWDQGQRGTCVAFSAIGLVHYLRGRGGERPSPQFLYHQCKSIDGIPNESGTFCETAMKVLADRSISGSGDQWGLADAGITDESTWQYETGPISTNEARTPPPMSRRPHLYQSVRWANTKGEILRTSATGGAMVNELRYLISREKVPVVVGLELFPSINNPNIRRTGIVTLPFGNEMSSSRHAMLVVGYDDSEGAFLVRNSWGTGWALENPWQVNGHAIIPYAYFERYSIGPGYTMRNIDRLDSVDVPEARRLYNRRVSSSRRASSSGRLSATGRSQLTGSSTVAINSIPRQSWKKNPPKTSLLRRVFRRIF